MTRDEAAVLVAEVTAAWVADPESDVVWAGDHEGRRGVRMRQETRDFTTVWFACGDYTVAVEAYVGPPPRPEAAPEVYRLCLRRNATGHWRVFYALDSEGAIFLRGHIALRCLDPASLDEILGAVHDTIRSREKPLP